MTSPGGNVLAWLDDAIRHREAWAEQAAAVQGPFWSAQSLGTGRRTVFYVGGSDIANISRMNSRLVSAENQAVTPHIALNDPASVLRRCAADRKLIAAHPITRDVIVVRPDGIHGFGCSVCHNEDLLTIGYGWCDSLRALAEGYGWTGGER